jgi:quinol monooxygenase YgiN
MIRAIYRWNITPGKEDRFVQLWEDGTRKIKATCAGDMGAILIRSTTKRQRFVAIAIWESQEAMDQAHRTIEALKLRGPMPELIDVFEEVSEIGLTRPS